MTISFILDIWYHPAILSHLIQPLLSTSKPFSLNWPMSHAHSAPSRKYWACSEQWPHPPLTILDTSFCNYVGQRLQFSIGLWWYTVRSTINLIPYSLHTTVKRTFCDVLKYFVNFLRFVFLDVLYKSDWLKSINFVIQQHSRKLNLVFTVCACILGCINA